MIAQVTRNELESNEGKGEVGVRGEFHANIKTG